MADPKELLVHSFEGTQIHLEARSMWVSLGDLRRLVYEADKLHLVDEADVFAEGIDASPTTKQQFYLRDLTVKTAVYQRADH